MSDNKISCKKYTLNVNAYKKSIIHLSSVFGKCIKYRQRIFSCKINITERNLLFCEKKELWMFSKYEGDSMHVELPYIFTYNQWDIDARNLK